MPIRWAVASGNFSSTSTWNDGAILGIPTGSDDLFTNTFTVNVNQSFDALTLNNSARARDIATALMTSYNAPSPYVVASNSDGGAASWRAFDRNTLAGWVTSNAVISGWISYDFATGTVIDGYSLSAPNTNQ